MKSLVGVKSLIMRMGLAVGLCVAASTLVVSPSMPAQASGWSSWESLGGTLMSAPAVASWASGRLDVFAINESGSAIHKMFNGTWSGWEDLGGAALFGGPSCCYMAPAAVSWGSGRIDLFVTGIDKRLYHKWYTGGNWSGWENLGGALYSAPAVASWASGRLDVFAIGQNGSVMHKVYNGSWSGWENLGGTSAGEFGGFYAAPAAVSWGLGRIDLFVNGTNAALYHKVFNGSWSGWQQIGGTDTIDSAPTAASWGSGRLDVFAVNGVVKHAFYNGSWSGWEDLGGAALTPDNFSEAPAAVSWGVNRVDVFVCGTDSRLYHLVWQ